MFDVDGETTNNIIVGTFFTLLFLLLMACIVATSDRCLFYPYAADNANEICKDKGYDQYDNFMKMPLSKEPLAVQCEYIHNRKDVNIDGNIPIKDD